MERTIGNLAAMKGKVFVRLSTKDEAIRFKQMAEDEGFVFEDGVKPTARTCARIMAVNSDSTISYVGSIGAMAFQSGVKVISGEKLIRVDFEKYVSGDKHYLCRMKDILPHKD